MSHRRIHAYIYLLLVVLIWGSASSVIKYTLRGIDPHTFLAYRFTISGALAVAYFALFKPHVPKQGKTLLYSLLYGFVGSFAALTLLFVGLNASSVLDLTLLGTIMPLLITAGGVYFFHDHITKREGIGTALAFLGTLVALVYPLLVGNTTKLTGNIFLFAYVFFDIASVFIAKEATSRLKIPAAVLTNAGFFFASFMFVGFAVYLFGAEHIITAVRTLPLQYHLGVWFMAIFSGSFAYYLLVRGQQSIEISEAGLFAYLQPLISTPLAIFWLGESITPAFLIGSTIIASGVVLAEYKKKRKKETTSKRGIHRHI